MIHDTRYQTSVPGHRRIGGQKIRNGHFEFRKANCGNQKPTRGQVSVGGTENENLSTAVRSNIVSLGGG